MKNMRVVALTGCLIAMAGVAPAVADADTTASVVNGQIVVTGDDNANSIHIGQGGNPSGTSLPYQSPFGAAVWDDATGEQVTAGSGCTIGTSETYSGPVAYCATTPVPVVVNGNGGDDTLTLVNDDDTGSTFRGLESVTLNGGEGNDTFYPYPFPLASNATMTIDGGDGNDTVASDVQDYLCATGETGTITGDAGDDLIYGLNCTETVHGGDGNDSIAGGDGNDQLFGDAGSDTIVGNGGNDTIDGGSGQDVLSAGDSSVQPGAVTFNAVDGEADRITCGYGADTANIDQYDTVPAASSPNACAHVNVTTIGGGSGGGSGSGSGGGSGSGSGGSGSGSGSGGGSGSGTGATGTATRATTGASSAKLAVGCSGATGAVCVLTLRLTATETTVGTRVVGVTAAHRKRHTVVLGTAHVTLASGSVKTVTVGLNRAGKALLRSRKKLPATLTVTQSGRTVTRQRLTFKRRR